MIDLETLMPIYKESSNDFRIHIGGTRDTMTNVVFKSEPLQQVYNSRPNAEIARQKIFDFLRPWFDAHRQQLDLDDCYTQIALQEKELEEHNTKFIADLGPEAVRDFEEFMADARVTDKIEFVELPKGTDQDESIGVYKDIHVDQWTSGPSEDCYAGNMYAYVNSKWIKVPYEC